MLDNSLATTDEVSAVGGTVPTPTVVTLLAAEADANDAAKMTIELTTLLRVVVGVTMVRRIVIVMTGPKTVNV